MTDVLGGDVPLIKSYELCFWKILSCNNFVVVVTYVAKSVAQIRRTLRILIHAKFRNHKNFIARWH